MVVLAVMEVYRLGRLKAQSSATKSAVSPSEIRVSLRAITRSENAGHGRTQPHRLVCPAKLPRSASHGNARQEQLATFGKLPFGPALAVPAHLSQ